MIAMVPTAVRHTPGMHGISLVFSTPSGLLASDYDESVPWLFVCTEITIKMNFILDFSVCTCELSLLILIDSYWQMLCLNPMILSVKKSVYFVLILVHTCLQHSLMVELDYVHC